MTELSESVLHVVRDIPPGRVTTYGEIGRATETSARGVGRILHHGGHEIPWWRVVTADGRPYPHAVEATRAKYREEGTPLVDDDTGVRVDLARASWVPGSVRTTRATTPIASGRQESSGRARERNRDLPVDQ